MNWKMANKGSLHNFLFTLLGFQKTRSFTHLIFIIFIHVAAWCLFLLVPLIFYPIRVINNRFLYGELLAKLLPIGFFYFNYYYLLPRFFAKRKWFAYFGIVLACILIIAVQEVLIRQQIPGRGVRLFQTPRERVVIRDEPPSDFFVRTTDSSRIPPPLLVHRFDEPTILGIPRPMLLMGLNRSISVCIVLLLVGGLIRLSYSFLKNQNEKRTLENAHLNAEVKFLKSQINPHFLFNTLNSIYSQAHNKSEHTEYSILKLSDLLRYVLYESGEEKVPLEKDILYINNYISLQRMRLSAKVDIRFWVTGELQGHTIAPLLLISFIENAFKHGISYTQASVIQIEITVFEKTLTLHVSNPVVKSDTFADGGLGLKNVIRRLDLIYPGKYKLDISQRPDHYTVNLKIDLESDQLRID